MNHHILPRNSTTSGAASRLSNPKAKKIMEKTKKNINNYNRAQSSVSGLWNDCARSELGEDSVLFHGASSKADRRDYHGISTRSKSDHDNQSAFSKYAFSVDDDDDTSAATPVLDDSKSKLSLYLDEDNENDNSSSGSVENSPTSQSPSANPNRIIDVDLKSTADSTSDDSEMSALVLRIKAGQAKAAEAQIDSPLVLPPRNKNSKTSQQAKNRDTSLQDVLHEVFVPQQQKTPEGQQKPQQQNQHRPSLTDGESSPEHQQQQRKVDRRRSTLSRRSSCRQSKLLLANTSTMSQSCSALLSSDKPSEIVTTTRRVSLQSSGGSGSHSQRTLPTIKTSGSTSKRSTAASTRTAKSSKPQSSVPLRNRTSRGKDHSVPQLPSIAAIPEQSSSKGTTREPLTRTGKSSSQNRPSLLGRLYDSTSQRNFVKDETEVTDRESIDRAGGDDDDILREAFEYDARSSSKSFRVSKSKKSFGGSRLWGSSRQLTQPQDMEDTTDDRSASTKQRRNSRRESLARTLSETFSFRKSFRHRSKKNSQKEDGGDHQSSGSHAAGGRIPTNRTRTKEDRPIAPPNTRGTHIRNRGSGRGGLERGRSVRTMITRDDKSNPRHVLFLDPPIKRSESMEVWEQRGSF